MSRTPPQTRAAAGGDSGVRACLCAGCGLLRLYLSFNVRALLDAVDPRYFQRPGVWWAGLVGASTRPGRGHEVGGAFAGRVLPPGGARGGGRQLPTPAGHCLGVGGGGWCQPAGGGEGVGKETSHSSPEPWETRWENVSPPALAARGSVQGSRPKLLQGEGRRGRAGEVAGGLRGSPSTEATGSPSPCGL